MKKITLLLLTLLLLTGCSGDKYPDFLTENNWQYENMICTEYLYFGEDGELGYYEAGGTSVGDWNLYDKYEYDEENRLINLYHREDNGLIRQLQIIHQDEQSLMLKMPDRVIEFYADKDAVPYLDQECIAYISGYSGYNSIYNLEGNTVYIGPSGYDGDVDSKDVFRPYELAADAEFHTLYVETIITDEDENNSYEYQTLTKEEAFNNEDNSVGIGFVWYNDNLEVKEILFYGSLIIWE